MASSQRKYPKDEFARRGDSIYESRIQQTLSEADIQRYCAIDIETEEYELADDELTAVRRLRDRLPDAQPWVVRVGMPFVKRLSLRIPHVRRICLQRGRHTLSFAETVTPRPR